jgi:hypothetical protein
VAERGASAIDSIIGGAVGGAIAAIGLMRIARTEVSSGKQVVQRLELDPGATATLLPRTTYKFAIILLHGDGDQQVRLVVKVGEATYELRGDEQAIEVVANEPVEIAATNTDTDSPRSTMTVEVAYLSW